MIATENLIACEGYESTRHAGANDVILLSENINRILDLLNPINDDEDVQTDLTLTSNHGYKPYRISLNLSNPIITRV